MNDNSMTGSSGLQAGAAGSTAKPPVPGTPGITVAAEGVSWEEARSANLENWEDRVPLHEEAYGLSNFDDPAFISRVVADDLPVLEPHVRSGRLEGLSLCHLQCHIGTDTVSLARRGAGVVGVDFSRSALESAARLAERAGVTAEWVETDVLDAAEAVARTFDVVYTSIGTITWLADLDRWASQIAQLLNSGGVFYIRDGHPALMTLDEHAQDLRVRYPYFPDGTPLLWDDESTYVGDGRVEHTRTYEYPHSLAEIVNALLDAGLEILRLEEGQTLPWRFSPRMIEVPGGYAWPEEERRLVPCTFTIVARKR